MTTERRCGTCRWLRKYSWQKHGILGDCEYPLPPLPHWTVRYRDSEVSENAGFTCPTWEPRT